MKALILFVCDDCGRKKDEWFMNCTCSCEEIKSYLLCYDCKEYHNESEKCECRRSA